MDGTIYLSETLFDGTLEFLRYVRAIGGNGDSRNSSSNAGHGIYSGGKLTIKGDIGTAQGGKGKTTAGHGIYSKGDLNISDNATITNATGGASTDGYAGDGIHSDGKLTISGGTIGTTQGGTGKSGGAGIYSKDDLSIESGTIGSLGTDGKTPDTTTGALGGTSTAEAKGGNGIQNVSS